MFYSPDRLILFVIYNSLFDYSFIFFRIYSSYPFLCSRDSFCFQLPVTCCPLLPVTCYLLLAVSHTFRFWVTTDPFLCGCVCLFNKRMHECYPCFQNESEWGNSEKKNTFCLFSHPYGNTFKITYNLLESGRKWPS